MRTFPSGAVRDSIEGKGRFDLLPPRALAALARLLQEGAKHYGDRNWEKGMPLSVFLDSALRHLFQLLAGDTSEDHAVRALFNIAAFIETRERIEEGKLPRELSDLPLD